jgi:hypothetical protein
MSSNQRFFIAILALMGFGLYLHFSQSKREVERIAIAPKQEVEKVKEIAKEVSKQCPISSLCDDLQLPKNVNRMAHLFFSKEPLFPFMERVSYSSRVSWQEGRRAYLGDYARYYKTSKHFISASLNGKGNYLSDKVRQGDCFNVIKKDHPVEFHLALDLSRCKMWLFAYDGKDDTLYQLNQYDVCVGALNESVSSGCNTPCGVFSLGEDIAVYKEGVEGLYKNEKTEMISIFGKRWIPLQNVIKGNVVSCKGVGIHGVPFQRSEEGDLKELVSCIGQYASNGCIRVRGEDMEELFALIVSRPAFIHIEQDFSQIELPGHQVL